MALTHGLPACLLDLPNKAFVSLLASVVNANTSFNWILYIEAYPGSRRPNLRVRARQGSDVSANYKRHQVPYPNRQAAFPDNRK